MATASEVQVMQSSTYITGVLDRNNHIITTMRYRTDMLRIVLVMQISIHRGVLAGMDIRHQEVSAGRNNIYRIARAVDPI